MFICEKCLKDDDRYGFSWAYGPCEDCGVVTNCVEVYLQPVVDESARRRKALEDWRDSAEKAVLDRAYNPCPGCGKINAVEPYNCTCPASR